MTGADTKATNIHASAWMLGIALVVGMLGAYLIVDRLLFLRVAEIVVGQCISISAENARCGGRRNRYDCTRFTARIRFEVETGLHHLQASAGNARGHGQPISFAQHKVGESVAVIYNPRTPSEAYRSHWWDVWDAPLYAVVISVIF